MFCDTVKDEEKIWLRYVAQNVNPRILSSTVLAYPAQAESRSASVRNAADYSKIKPQREVVMNTANIIAKINSNYICSKCGSTERAQAHHRVPKEDDTLIILCAECHSLEHPDIPKALFFCNNNQPYWNNKSASSIARELGIHSRTVIRAARILNLSRGELSPWDEQLLVAHLNRYKTVREDKQRRRKELSKERKKRQQEITSERITRIATERTEKMLLRTGATADRWRNKAGIRCPKCRSTKLYKDGFVHKKQRYHCNKCGSVTIAPKVPGMRVLKKSREG